jgi:hypothetical protein
MVENHPKSSKTTSKAPKKTLQNPLFRDTPKWLFTSGPGYLALAIIENDQKKDRKQTKIAQNPSKTLIFRNPKSAQRSIDHQKLSTRKNDRKPRKIKQNYLKNTKKNLQNPLFLDTPKRLFTSGPGHLAS